MTVQGTKPSQDCSSHHRWSRHFAEHHTAANGLPQDQEEKRGTDVSEPGGQMHMRESLYPNYETHHLTWMDIWCHKTRLWQQKISGINFLCLSKITYDTKTMMLVSYYQRYWAHIFQNVSHGRDIIHLDNDRAPANNKVIGPAFEKYIDMAILNFCLSWHFQFFQLFWAHNFSYFQLTTHNLSCFSTDNTIFFSSKVASLSPLPGHHSHEPVI